MRFERLDLNLLVALDALLTERSVSLAAERLCLSQSATSSALARLREYFGDDLLVLKGRQMVLTARASELMEPVRSVLEQVRTTIAVAPPFDPATCERRMRVMASDYITEVLLSDVLSSIASLAPHIIFEVQSMNSAPLEALDRGHVDLLVTLDYVLSADHPSRVLFQDDYVVIGDKKNSALRKPMTRELYFSLGHVTARFGEARTPAFEDWFMSRQKQQRRIEIVAPSFLSVPTLVLGANRIATVQRRLANRLAAKMPIVVLEPPFAIPPIREAVQWRISNDSDEALRWVVDQMASIAAGIGPEHQPRADLQSGSLAIEFRSDQIKKPR